MQLLSRCHHIHAPAHSPSCAMNTNEYQHCRSHLPHLHLLHDKQGGVCPALCPNYLESFCDGCYMASKHLLKWIGKLHTSWPPEVLAPVSRDECVQVNGTSRVETENIPETADIPHYLQVDGLSMSALLFRTTA